MKKICGGKLPEQRGPIMLGITASPSSKWRPIGWGTRLKGIALAFVALLAIGSVRAWGDYTATQGSGTNFGSLIVSTVHYVKQIICDQSGGGATCATVTAGNALKVDNSAVTQPVSGTVTANQGGTWTVQPGNTANTTAWLVSVPTWAGGTLGAMANYGTSPGAVLVPGVNAFITNTPNVVVSSALPTGANTIGGVTQATSPWVDNITQFGGTNLSTGTGAGGAGIPRVTVSNDSNVLATQSGTWTVQPGNTANTTPWLVTHTLGTTAGWTTKLLNALTTTVISIKASGGQLGKLYCWNPNSTVAYIQVFNVASGSVTLGTTTPNQSYGIPPATSAGFSMPVNGDQYGTAISIAATTTATGNTALTTAVDCNASFN